MFQRLNQFRPTNTNGSGMEPTHNALARRTAEDIFAALMYSWATFVATALEAYLGPWLSQMLGAAVAWVVDA